MPYMRQRSLSRCVVLSYSVYDSGEHFGALHFSGVPEEFSCYPDSSIESVEVMCHACCTGVVGSGMGEQGGESHTLCLVYEAGAGRWCRPCGVSRDDVDRFFHGCRPDCRKSRYSRVPSLVPKSGENCRYGGDCRVCTASLRWQGAKHCCVHRWSLRWRNSCKLYESAPVQHVR